MSGQSKHLFSTDPIIMQFNNLLGELVNSLKRVTNDSLSFRHFAT